MTGIQDDLATLRTATMKHVPVGISPTANDCLAALARVEAEIARLTDEQLVKYERGDDFHHDFWKERAEAAEAEVARLKDGLRWYADMDNWDMSAERWVWIAEHPPYLRADALLAEDGAADDEAIARTVRYRDAWDDGKRLTIEELEKSIEEGGAA